jgi:hypothetical protein
MAGGYTRNVRCQHLPVPFRGSVYPDLFGADAGQRP